MSWINDRIKQLERQLDDPEILDKRKIEIKLDAYRELLNDNQDGYNKTINVRD